MTPRTTPPPLPKIMPQRAQRPQAEVPSDAAPVVAPRMPQKRAIARRALVGLLLLVLLAAGGAWLLDASIDHAEEARSASEEGRTLLGNVKSWGYQLQRVDISQAAGSAHDLIVVDEAVASSRSGAAGASDVARLKRKPDGERRLVLSYLSIGEAEDYRRYWRSGWVGPATTAAVVKGPLTDIAALNAPSAQAQLRLASTRPEKPMLQPTSSAPAWLGAENPEWRGNFSVRFWHAEWKALVLGSKEAALDRIIAAGFDGVYLDRADVYNLWRRERPTAKTDMAAFVAEIAAHARLHKPGFLVVMQNAEELLSTKSLREALDGVAKEDLLFGIAGEGRENTAADIEASLGYLRMAKSEGLPVLVVEYLGDEASMARARTRIEGEGFVPYFGPRMLNSLQQAN